MFLKSSTGQSVGYDTQILCTHKHEQLHAPVKCTVGTQTHTTDGIHIELVGVTNAWGLSNLTIYFIVLPGSSVHLSDWTRDDIC